MTKEQAEARILKHLRAIEKIYEKVDPAGDYLDLAICGDYIRFNNAYWNKPTEQKIDVAVERFTEDDFDSR